MPPSRSRYRPDAPPDYSHRFHAGNVGDVWKHCALVEVLRRLRAAEPRVVYLETHAGEGRYPLLPTGEWTEGIGRLWDVAGPAEGAAPSGTDGEGGHAPDEEALARYVALCRRLGTSGTRPEVYPGSTAIARALLGPEDRLVLWESSETALARLCADAAGDPRVELRHGDAWSRLGDAAREAVAGAPAHLVALVDPPYGQKGDWILAADALAAAAHAVPEATLLLWYPIKSLTRPNAIHLRVEAAGVAATAAELVTTPLTHQRRRLNGSGLLLVRPPAGALEAIAAAAPAIGRRCATRAGTWSSRMVAWGAAAR